MDVRFDWRLYHLGLSLVFCWNRGYWIAHSRVATINTHRPEVLILLHLNFINFSNQVEGSEIGSVSRKACLPLSDNLFCLLPACPALFLPAAWLRSPCRAPTLLAPMLKMRLQYLNDYDNQSRDPELRLRLIFLSRTKKPDAFGDMEVQSGFLACVFFSPWNCSFRSLFLLLTRRRVWFLTAAALQRVEM